MDTPAPPTLRRFDATAEYEIAERCAILELANDATDPAVSIARARVAPGVTTARHRLRGTVERYLILEGRGRVDVDGLPSAEVGPGDSVTIPAMCGQRIENLGDSDLLFLAICTPRFVPDCYESLE
ncbi:MAG: cupin domain-containing protein [Burkholderiales bacterium]|nr:MAG: cupin domain-containing protein [Burkholderiales bacterium]